MHYTCLTLSSSDWKSVLEFVNYVYEFHGLVSALCMLVKLWFLGLCVLWKAGATKSDQQRESKVLRRSQPHPLGQAERCERGAAEDPDREDGNNVQAEPERLACIRVCHSCGSWVLPACALTGGRVLGTISISTNFISIAGVSSLSASSVSDIRFA